MKYTLLRKLAIISTVTTILYGFFCGTGIGYGITIGFDYVMRNPLAQRTMIFYVLIVISVVLCVFTVVQWRKEQRVKHQVDELHQSPYKKSYRLTKFFYYFFSGYHCCSIIIQPTSKV
jgi:uncharacterized membrane protein